MDKLTDDDFRRRIDDFIDEWHNSASFITAHTSGSTGKPKAIHLPKDLVRRSAVRSIRHFGITSSSRLHLALSPEYIAGKMLIVRALEAGCRLTAEAPSSSPLKHCSDLTPITLISLVGSQLEGLVSNRDTQSIPPIRHFLLGGAPLNPSMRSLAMSGDWECWESYGMTETASHVALRTVGTDPEAPFTALPGITFSLSPDACLAIHMGEDGTILTNDIAELLSPTHFRLLGRRDNVIISGGLKIFPEQVENILAPYMAGRRFYVTSRDSRKWGKSIVLVIEGTQMPVPDFHSLPLKPCERPSHTIFMPHIPLTPSGKIKRQTM